MKAAGGKIPGREPDHLHIFVLDLHAHWDVAGGDNHVHARGVVGTRLRLQIAVNTEADECAQRQSDNSY